MSPRANTELELHQKRIDTRESPALIAHATEGLSRYIYSTIRTCKSRVRSNAINVSLPAQRSRFRSLHKVLCAFASLWRTGRFKGTTMGLTRTRLTALSAPRASGVSIFSRAVYRISRATPKSYTLREYLGNSVFRAETDDRFCRARCLNNLERGGNNSPCSMFLLFFLYSIFVNFFHFFSTPRFLFHVISTCFTEETL